ncbi:AzlD domain-containing protein [Dickeya sp. DW 0440]|nr:AzlD domain-containing protein [Dickeya sp. DW 0440]
MFRSAPGITPGDLLQQQTLRPFPKTPYLWGAIASVVIAWWIRQTLLAVVTSLGVFYLLCLGLL